MATKHSIAAIILSAGLFITGCSNQAGATDAQGSTGVGTAPSSNSTPASIESLTIEQLRAAQEDIEAQIQEIKIKDDLSRPQKIRILKLQDRLIKLENAESKILKATIANYDKALDNFAKVKTQIRE